MKELSPDLPRETVELGSRPATGHVGQESHSNSDGQGSLYKRCQTQAVSASSNAHTTTSVPTANHLFNVLGENMLGDQVAVFAAASEAFSAANINCSVQESLDRFKPVLERAAAASVPVRGYVSCVLGCPYEGRVAPLDVVKVSKQGCL